MSVVFDPFSGNLIDTGSSGAGATIGGVVPGSDPNSVLIIDSSSTLQSVVLNDGQLLIGATGADPIATSLTGTTNQIVVTNGVNSITLSTPQNIHTGASPTFNALTLTTPLSQSSGGTGVSTATNGQLLIGNGTGFSVSTLTGTADQVNVTNGSGTITLSLPQSLATTSSPTFANLNLTPSGAVDTTTTGTLAIGTANADVINIGNAGATVNIQGTTYYQNVTDLQVTDKNITLNVGGSAGSASNSGIQIEENALITAYVETSADRNSWTLKAPNQTGIITLSPGASGFTIDQGSHDPVTIGTANGLSLSTQVLSMALANGTVTGTVSATDYNTFNNKQPAGNYITDITGDATASGPGSATLTFATVNADIGTFNNVTVNAKGLVTAATNVAYLTGNQTITLSGDVTGSGTTTITTTIASTVVTSKLITGFVSGAGTVAATDTILQAINKLDGNNATKVTTVTGDIVPTTWSGLVNNTANQTITGLSFASTVSSFESLMSIYIDATTDTYTTVKLLGTRQSPSDWSVNDIQTEFTGNSIVGLAFNITTAGQVQISIGDQTGFSSGVVKFRAITV